MKLNWVIICYKETDSGVNILHICAYENKPKEIDWNSLREELAIDEEFGRIGDTDYEMILINREDGPWWFDYL